MGNETSSLNGSGISQTCSGGFKSVALASDPNSVCGALRDLSKREAEYAELILENESNCEVEVSLAKLLMFPPRRRVDESLTTHAFRFAKARSAAKSWALLFGLSAAHFDVFG
jgi:hypothetical protein